MTNQDMLSRINKVLQDGVEPEDTKSDTEMYSAKSIEQVSRLINTQATSIPEPVVDIGDLSAVEILKQRGRNKSIPSKAEQLHRITQLINQ